MLNSPVPAAARRLAAIRHLGRAVAALYDLDPEEVLWDAARFAGVDTPSEIAAERRKAVIDYLCGRLLLPASDRAKESFVDGAGGGAGALAPPGFPRARE
jgi:hypothetical protein